MPVTIYGDGTLYGDADAIYGRIGAGLSAAQEAKTRETALRVSVIDERSNRWESFTNGTATLLSGDDYRSLGNDITKQNWAFNRLSNDSVLLANGNIYRVRVGTGANLTDFGIYDQTVTDPTIAAQWNTWNLLYSGTHYAVAVANNGNTPHVYAAKSDGLYRDNVLKWSQPNIINIQCVINTFDALFVTVVSKDLYDHHRVMDIYYTADIMSATPAYDPVNYRWQASTMAAILLPDGTVDRYQSIPRYRPREGNNGESITVAKMPSISDNTPTAPRIIRGLAGQVGHNIIRNLMLSDKLSDGYYYLFYGEKHENDQYEYTSNVGSDGKWQRSKDGIHWSEAVSSGGYMGRSLLETGGYVWAPSFDAVYRRPATPVVYDVSNYVPKASMEIPRDNQEGGGTLTVANPSGVNDALLTLSDRRLVIEVGLRTADGSYEYTEFNDWWIKRIVQDKEGSTNRLTIEFGDVWTRLNSSLNDNFNFIGQLKYNDWGLGNRNKAFNYYFRSDTAPSEADDHLTTKGIVLYTGLKTQNGTAQAHFSGLSGDPALIFRYIDDKNYQRIERSGSLLTFYDRVNGVDTQIDSGACTSDSTPTLKIIFRWEKYWAYVNGVLIFSGTYQYQPNVAQGYVGFKATKYTISAFYVEDWEPTINAEELVKTALAMGDYHDVITGSSSSEELAVIWGPQTDNPTPAAGLLAALEAVKWQLVWIDHRILVGSFKDISITKIIQDRIIKTDYADEASRRINRADVDGNDTSWIEIDRPDTVARDRQISAYFDLPELTDQDSVSERAREEIRLGKMGRTPGGDLVLYFDLQRMDMITWIDNSGLSQDVRVEGISIEINQSMEPSQRETIDTSKQDG